MRKFIVLFLATILISKTSLSQSVILRGNITDTVEKKLLVNGSVLLLRKSDSIMISFTRTDKNGNFQFKNLYRGQFLIMVNYPQYADFIDDIDIKDSAAIMDLPRIMMTLKSQLLKTVVVNGVSAIRLKGDTTEFKADSFKVQPNASVEDLLKKLPGIQVDKNGKITAQGETVQKVLVDGEEFFGDDPTLVTKNLRADMVDKVQVFDKKSDQATFTGIDDGEKTKTLNIKLKEDKKNGYFGKLSAAAGSDGYHDSQAMYNKFRKKEKFSIYGIVSNTGTAGLNWTDQNNFGGSNGILNADENGNIIGTDDISPWDGNYNGQGYPLVQTGGVHYNNKWDNDKHSINGNYKIMQLYVNGNNATNSEFILPDSTTSYYQNQQQSFKNQVLRNKLDGSYEWTIDTTSSLKLDFGGTLIHKSTYGTNATQSLHVLDSSRVNNAVGRTSTESDNNGLTSQLFWRKKLKKKGRTISINVKENYGYYNSTGYLYSQNNYFTGDTLSFSQLTDQYKTGSAKDLNIKANATYTESLSRYVSMVLNYGVIIDNRSADKLSFNKSAGGKYDSLNGLYSSNYVFNTFTQKGGLFLNLKKKKYYFDLGTNLGYSDFKQHDLIADTLGKRSFVNWYPSAYFRYMIATQNSIDINYNGNTSQPSLQQIQPFRNNDDPLNIAIGNAALKPSFKNNIRLNYYFFKALTNQNLWTSVDYSFTENAFSTNSYVDSIGRRVTQSINVNGNYSLTANMNYGFKWKKPDINFNLNGNINKYRNESVVNNQQNITNSDNYTLGFYGGKYKEKKYDLSLQASATYTTSSSSIQTTFATKYWSYIIQPNFDFFLPLKLQIHTDLNYNIRQKVAAFNNNANVALWNAWLGKKLLKSDNLLIKISVNDILNQNKGISRNVNSNFISQNTYSTIQRYALLSLVWNFNKAGTAAPQNNGMIMISN